MTFHFCAGSVAEHSFRVSVPISLQLPVSRYQLCSLSCGQTLSTRTLCTGIQAEVGFGQLDPNTDSILEIPLLFRLVIPDLTMAGRFG